MVELAVRVGLALVVVLGLLVAYGRATKRGRARDGGLAVLARKQLNRSCSVALVRVADRTLVLGVTERRVSLLTEAPEPPRLPETPRLADLGDVAPPFSAGDGPASTVMDHHAGRTPESGAGELVSDVPRGEIPLRDLVEDAGALTFDSETMDDHQPLEVPDLVEEPALVDDDPSLIEEPTLIEEPALIGDPALGDDALGDDALGDDDAAPGGLADVLPDLADEVTPDIVDGAPPTPCRAGLSHVEDESGGPRGDAEVVLDSPDRPEVVGDEPTATPSVEGAARPPRRKERRQIVYPPVVIAPQRSVGGSILSPKTWRSTVDFFRDRTVRRP